MAIKAVVLGYGLSGKSFHRYLILKEERITLHGVFARSPETQEQIKSDLPGATIYTDYAQVLSDPAVNLVIVATATNTHFEFTKSALLAGKHVVVDKPMCVTSKECDELIALSKSSGRLLAVFMNRRLDSDFLTVQRLIAEGRLGPSIRWVEASWVRPGVSLKAWKTEGLSTGGGSFYDLGSHRIDQVLSLYRHKAVTSVYCRMHFDHSAAPKIDSHALVVLGFEDGSTGVVDTSSAVAFPKPTFQIAGTEATFQKFGVDPQEAFMKLEKIEQSKDDEKSYGRLRKLTHSGAEDEVIATIDGPHWLQYYSEVANSITSNTPFFVGLESLQRLMRVFDAALESVEKGAVVNVNIPACPTAY